MINVPSDKVQNNIIWGKVINPNELAVLIKCVSKQYDNITSAQDSWIIWYCQLLTLWFVSSSDNWLIFHINNGLWFIYFGLTDHYICRIIQKNTISYLFSSSVTGSHCLQPKSIAFVVLVIATRVDVVKRTSVYQNNMII